MRIALLAFLGGAFLLAACSNPAATDDSAAGHRGRYIGIGTYSVGRLWSKMVLQAQQNPKSAATLVDDEHVIVVVDSNTGEIRECGDYTGVCVSMNPWTKAIADPQRTPVALTKHAAEVDQQARAAFDQGAKTSKDNAARQ